MSSNLNFNRSTVVPYGIIIILTLVIGYLLFKNPSKIEENSNNLIITEIKAIGKLELAHLSIKDVVEHTVKRDYLPDSKILMVVVGETAGCIDLTKITAEKIKLSDSVVEITLPLPEICFTAINHKQSKIYSALTFVGLDNDFLLSETIYKKAEASMKSDSLQQIVFIKTKENAAIVLKPLLEKIVQKKVILKFANNLTGKN